MNIKKNIALAGALLGLLAVLSSCSGVAGKPVNRMRSYTPQNVMRFGDWLIDPVQLNKGVCRIDGNTTDVQITTDGMFTGTTIELRLVFAMPLVRPPSATISSYPVDLPLEGANKVYNIQLAYDPTTAAHLLAEDTFLTISYQPLNEGLPREVNLTTRGLVQALAVLGKYCPN